MTQVNSDFANTNSNLNMSDSWIRGKVNGDGVTYTGIRIIDGNIRYGLQLEKGGRVVVVKSTDGGNTWTEKLISGAF